jgi:adenylyltransferase/sulfurtransferase
MEFRTVKLRRNPQCPACGTHELQALIDYQQFCGIRGDEEDVSGIPAITVSELEARRRRGDPVDLVDVREPHEWDIGRIEGARLAPLSRFTESLRTFDSARDTVLYCKSGVRSAKAVRQLRDAGFRRVWNLQGGILRWSEEIDPTVPRY